MTEKKIGGYAIYVSEAQAQSLAEYLRGLSQAGDLSGNYEEINAATIALLCLGIKSEGGQIVAEGQEAAR